MKKVSYNDFGKKYDRKCLYIIVINYRMLVAHHRLFFETDLKHWKHATGAWRVKHVIDNSFI